MTRKLAIMLAAILLGLQAHGQEARYRFDLGASVGMSGYNGDANSGFTFRRPGVAAALFGRYNFDTRWGATARLGVQGLSGDTRDMDSALPDGAQFSFKSTLYTLDVRAEFNFFPYGIGETYKRLRRCTPYVSAGLGGALSSVDGRRYAALTIPVGVGVKYKPSQRLNLFAELTYAKALSDHMDGGDLADLYRIKSSFLKNTDWYATLAVGVSYEFGERCTVCNRLD